MPSRHGLRASRVAVLGLLAALLPAGAWASPVLETLGAPEGNGGMQGVVSGPSAASTYFDPALLSFADDAFLAGVSVLSDDIGIRLDRRTSGDVPLVVGERGVLGSDGRPVPNDTVPTAWLERGCPAGSATNQCPPPGFTARPRQADGSGGKTRAYLALGFVKQVVRDRFTLGMFALLPLSSFTSLRGFYADEREALFSNSLHPELFGDRMTALSLSLGAALRLHRTLSVGASVGLSLANTATSRTYVRSSTDYDQLLLDNSVETGMSFSPVVGVAWRPTERLRFGAAARAPSSFTLDTTITATLPSGTESGTERRETYHDLPWRLAVGAEFDVVKRGTYAMSVTASITHATWSTYRDRHGGSPSDYGKAFAWSDTTSGSVGVRHAWGHARAFFDLSWVPSPVPPQTGRSNYVDGDRAGIAFGADVDVTVFGLPIRPGVVLGVQRVVPRDVRKDPSLLRDEVPDDAVLASTRRPVPGREGLQTNDPGWPGFGSGGFVWTGSFSVAVPFEGGRRR
ncbi:MAG: hypothetical protein U0169_08255 [Polyangiaceae bacterium]